MIKVYGIKNCDSVKKALSFFKKHALDYEFIDYKTQPLPCEIIKSWLKDVSIEKLFNAKSTTYRELKLKELNLDDESKSEWLCKHNLLIKRPVVVTNKGILVGFDEAIYEGELL